MHRQSLPAKAGPLTLLLALSTAVQPLQAQEDCFNDDETVAHAVAKNDLEPPMTPMPALTVSDEDFARVLAAIAEHERRIGARRENDSVQTRPIAQ